ncbi:MAG: hypothetical protein H0V70_19390 [Ktedonobacteraceae bacterium]|nr:hypothetical protein [Ktedonobacteraceae bacterium]
MKPLELLLSDASGKLSSGLPEAKNVAKSAAKPARISDLYGSCEQARTLKKEKARHESTVML